MKLTNTTCKRCREPFDFDLYSGLCPNCGCFHQQPGVSNNTKTIVRPEVGSVQHDLNKHLSKDAAKGISHNQHKTTKQDPHIEAMVRDADQMKKVTYNDIKNGTADKSSKNKTTNLNGHNYRNGKAPVAAMVISIVLVLSFSFCFTYLESRGINSLDDFVYYVKDLFSSDNGFESADDSADDISNEENSDSSNIEVSELEDVDMDAVDGDIDTLETDTAVYGGDYYYYVNCLWEMGDSEDIAEFANGFVVPEGKTLVALDLEMYYYGTDPEDETKYFMPSLFDGEEYCAPIDAAELSGITDAYGITEYSMDPKKIYSNPPAGEDEYYNDGYLYYLISDECCNATVCLEFRSDGQLNNTGYMEVPVQDIDSAYGDVVTDLNDIEFEEVEE